MNILTRLKKIIMALSVAVVAMILFVTTPVAYAATPINTDVQKYTYEKDDIYYSDGYFASLFASENDEKNSYIKTA